MPVTARYHGKPLLRLLECYGLKAINELAADDAANLTAMQPKLARVYKNNGTWDQIIAATMELPEQMPTLIVQMWERNQEIAKARNIPLYPQQFAEIFVDENLS